MTDERPALRVVPCTLKRANAVVAAWHRHHPPTAGGLFAVAVCDPSGRIRGAAIAGRPVARALDDGWTVEVLRVATDGCPNACSALYGAARRVAGALGYSRFVTYTRADESGASLRAAGLELAGTVTARSWDTPTRPRLDSTERVARSQWRARPTGRPPVALIWPLIDDAQLEISAAPA